MVKMASSAGRAARCRAQHAARCILEFMQAALVAAGSMACLATELGLKSEQMRPAVMTKTQSFCLQHWYQLHAIVVSCVMQQLCFH